MKCFDSLIMALLETTSEDRNYTCPILTLTNVLIYNVFLDVLIF